MDYKQAIIVRTDLKMSKGKLAAQACHAALDAYLRTKELERDAWKDEGAKKVVLRVSSEADLIERFEAAKALGLPAALIKDAGLTEIAPGTKTAVGIGPAKEEDVDKVTRDLFPL